MKTLMDKYSSADIRGDWTLNRNQLSKLAELAKPIGKIGSVRSKFLNLQSSASIFFQILSQVRKLRQSAKFSKVFVKPECWKKKGY